MCTYILYALLFISHTFFIQSAQPAEYQKEIINYLKPSYKAIYQSIIDDSIALDLTSNNVDLRVVSNFMRFQEEFYLQSESENQKSIVSIMKQYQGKLNSVFAKNKTTTTSHGIMEVTDLTEYRRKGFYDFTIDKLNEDSDYIDRIAGELINKQRGKLLLNKLDKNKFLRFCEEFIFFMGGTWYRIKEFPKSTKNSNYITPNMVKPLITLMYETGFKQFSKIYYVEKGSGYLAGYGVIYDTEDRNFNCSILQLNKFTQEINSDGRSFVDADGNIIFDNDVSNAVAKVVKELNLKANECIPLPKRIDLDPSPTYREDVLTFFKNAFETKAQLQKQVEPTQAATKVVKPILEQVVRQYATKTGGQGTTSQAESKRSDDAQRQYEQLLNEKNGLEEQIKQLEQQIKNNQQAPRNSGTATQEAQKRAEFCNNELTATKAQSKQLSEQLQQCQGREKTLQEERAPQSIVEKSQQQENFISRSWNAFKSLFGR